MMAVLRRWIGVREQREEEKARERERQYAIVRAGLEDAARRVRFVEAEADVLARAVNIQRTDREKTGTKNDEPTT